MGSAIDYDTSALAHEDEGYHKGLKPRQLPLMDEFLDKNAKE